MPFLHYGSFHSLSPFFGRFGVPRFAWFLVQSFLTTFSLRHATVVRRVIFLSATVNLFRGSQFSSVRIFLTTFLLHHATVARRVIFLPATVDLLLDSQIAPILHFGFRGRPAARFRPLRRFLSPPTDITAASSLETS
jgi:hypothetical protein